MEWMWTLGAALVGAVVGGLFAITGVLISLWAARQRMISEKLADECLALVFLLRRLGPGPTRNWPDFDDRVDRIAIWCKHDAAFLATVGEHFNVLNRFWIPVKEAESKTPSVDSERARAAGERYKNAIIECFLRLPAEGEYRFYAASRELLRFGVDQSHQRDAGSLENPPPLIRRGFLRGAWREQLRLLRGQDAYINRLPGGSKDLGPSTSTAQSPTPS